ncbi:PadR family transcriptional regulator [Halobacillus salinarum]|uniref:PadR family transcriptional regulator n=1 Tax=Halobacillus salinarum TaxID=2932257 RepID=A0ABY4ELG0_9BACI|nr:PadR family transcriptional regulator [Halobacillus salinarum]UOQ44911.1 PadR family transcriptional regulator [Halobacillus salinarum]
MDQSVFKSLRFSETHRKEVHKKIKGPGTGEEEILISILQLLENERTGFTLSKKLRARGIVKFEDNEGHLYTALHKLEHKAYLCSKWKEDGGKYYRLTQRGARLLQKYESSSHQKDLLQPLIEVLQP